MEVRSAGLDDQPHLCGRKRLSIPPRVYEQYSQDTYSMLGLRASTFVRRNQLRL